MIGVTERGKKDGNISSLSPNKIARRRVSVLSFFLLLPQYQLIKMKLNLGEKLGQGSNKYSPLDTWERKREKTNVECEPESPA